MSRKDLDRTIAFQWPRVASGEPSDSQFCLIVLKGAEIRNRITYDQLPGLLTKESLYLALQMELERCLRDGSME